MKRIFSIAKIITVTAVSTAIAGNGPGTSAVSFLNIGVSARSTATGGALSTVTDGPVSAYYNPAGLAGVENKQIAGMHSEWLEDLRYEYLGFAAPIGQKGGLGVSFSYLSYGDIDGYSSANQATGNLTAYDISASISYGRQLRPGLSMGVGVKTVVEKLDDTGANGFAGDIGLQYQTGRLLTGMSIMNFGPGIKYESSSSPLPTTVNAGVAFFPFDNSLSMMAGIGAPLSGGVSFKAGLEYSYAKMLVLRTGFDSEQAQAGQSGISFGGGLNFSSHSLDYAYNLNSMFGGTHQFSFLFGFGQPRARQLYSQNEPPRNIEYVGPKATGAEKRDSRYYVCAAKYSDEDSAHRHIKTLKMFGVKAQLIKAVQGEYWVVLKTEKKKNKAEEQKRNFEKKGVPCFIIDI